MLSSVSVSLLVPSGGFLSVLLSLIVVPDALGRLISLRGSSSSVAVLLSSTLVAVIRSFVPGTRGRLGLLLGRCVSFPYSSSSVAPVGFGLGVLVLWCCCCVSCFAGVCSASVIHEQLHARWVVLLHDLHVFRNRFMCPWQIAHRVGCSS